MTLSLTIVHWCSLLTEFLSPQLLFTGAFATSRYALACPTETLCRVCSFAEHSSTLCCACHGICSWLGVQHWSFRSSIPFHHSIPLILDSYSKLPKRAHYILGYRGQTSAVLCLSLPVIGSSLSELHKFAVNFLSSFISVVYPVNHL